VQIAVILALAAAVVLLVLYVRARTALAAAEARLDAERAASGEKMRILEQARDALKETFASLSADALRANNESFLQIARTELESKRGAIEQIVRPLHDSLTKVDTKLGEVEKERASNRAQLDEQLRSLSQTHQSLQTETGKLVRALRSPNQRGRWGEVQLRNVIERSGMVAHCDFVEKESAQTDEGRRVTPDMIVRLPNGASIVVDSKVPIDAYLTAADALEEHVREQLLREHTRQLREHIRGLGNKAYWSRFTPTPELVVMFVPGEPLLSTALQRDATLFDYAVEQKVIPSSPLMLVALLRTVATAWQQQRLTENAEQIHAMGRELYERLATMADHVVALGQGLRRAGEAYDDFVGSLDGRVLVSARRFRELGVSAVKEVPDLPPLHLDVREPRAPELRAPVQESLIDAKIVTSDADVTSNAEVT
jgi:DNA recombination protein RmuC